MSTDKYKAERYVFFPVLMNALGIDISKMKTRKEGREWYGPCPIHQAKNNQTSFSYNEDGKYHCFSCSAKGSGAIDLTMAIKGLKFNDAVAFLTPLTQTTSTPPKPVSAVSLASQEAVEAGSAELKPLKDTYRKFQVACPWLEARVPDAGVREKYGVFCYQNPARKSAYSGRVMLPFKDAAGRLFGYMGRSPEGEPLYLVPSGFPKGKFLFGLHELLPGKKLYLVESPFTVLKFASLGIPALSPYGWSVSDAQLALLKDLGRGIIYLPDKNKTAEAATVCAKLARIGWVKCPDYPAEDPEHLSLDQIRAL